MANAQEEFASHQNELSTIMPRPCCEIEFLTLHMSHFFQRDDLFLAYADTVAHDLLGVVNWRKHNNVIKIIDFEAGHLSSEWPWRRGGIDLCGCDTIRIQGFRVSRAEKFGFLSSERRLAP
jgi:hypothetical protein